MNRLNIYALALVLTASVAAAHSGVKNPAVKARMDAMGRIVAEMKILGTMASGATEFNIDQAKHASAQIAQMAAATPDLFRAHEDDPKSESKAIIWTQFDDFTAKAAAMENIALKASANLTVKEDISELLTALGTTCKSCHAIYRE